MIYKLKAPPKLMPSQRLHECPLPIIGLTGGIASGKSAVSKLLIKMGVEIIDADRLVKLAYQKPEVIAAVANLSPAAHSEGKIDFKILRSLVFKNDELKLAIEALIYAELPGLFLAQLPRQQNFVVYDVPLLFERKLVPLVDYSVVVYASRAMQKERLMARDQIDGALAEQMLAAQESLEIKKAQADFVIDNSSSLEKLESEVKRFLNFFVM